VIVFLDTSALVPLLVEEPSSAVCRRIWDTADAAVCTQLAYVETAAALARAARLGRMTADELTDRLERFEVVWGEVDVLPVDEPLVREAAALTRSFPLRGFDAVHCAAALRLADIGATAVSGDRQLIEAWRRQELDVVDTRT
jgi:uncharacterized protein